MNSTDGSIIGAGPPPPGITPNFVNPSESIAGRLILTAAIFPAFTVPIVILRLYTSGFIVRRWHADDYLIAVALIFAIANSVISGIQTENGAGLHIWDVPLPSFMRFMKLGSIGGSVTYNMGTVFIKTSILAFYVRFSPDNAFRITVFLTMFVAVGYSVANGFSFLYLCQPMEKFWDYTVPGHCIDSFNAYLASAALNVGTDIVILLLPIWMLWPLRVPTKKKILVTLILMAGGFVCAVSIVRLNAILLGTNETDFTWYYVINLIWNLCEMYTGIICACLPCLRAFAKHHFPNWGIFMDDGGNNTASLRSFSLPTALRLSRRGRNNNGQSEASKPSAVSTNWSYATRIDTSEEGERDPSVVVEETAQKGEDQ
ncbi:hypothetical protein QBC46DRAFT_309058 [Diplogelasinospora grovesii]|uniref:Rhodopsin domain-containing protein n=1 Tax=Diplogelasinospora grovesii TaxID=303347 RepID=A0AAN6NCG1_9PEZI|nr:hypothetical protein QBC46DRAFT_309058 [Diplogelasinospora grovesii]